VIDTALGRIGVNICYEILLHERVNELYEAGIDLYLQPAATGRPKPFIPGDVARFEKMLLQGRKVHHQALGVPVVLANRVGRLEGQLPGRLPYLKSSFPGLSYIADSDGRILAELAEEEGVIVSQVTLDPQRKATIPPKCYGRQWAVPVPWYSFIWPLTQKWGERVYQQSDKRRNKAREMG
jgi:N-carbamoylputrescine amidase